ncbi:MAG: hypothetical protein ABI862_12905 [Ilumatobacteraceae bacterium]
MIRDPLQKVFEQLDYPPAPGFREALRSQLLAELHADATTTSDLRSGDDIIDETHEIVVLDTVERPVAVRHTRVLIAAAAAVIVAVGVAAVLVSRRDSPEDYKPIASTTTVNSALITADQIGPGWSHDVSIKTSWAHWRDAFAEQPECAAYTAVVKPLEETAAGSIAALINLQNQAIAEDLTIFATKDAASRVMDSVVAPGFQNCYFAAFDAASRDRFPGGGALTKSYSVEPPPEHGDRQITFGQETRTTVNGATRLFYNAWIQVDRAVIHLLVSPDGLRVDDPASNLNRAISAAITSLDQAISAAERPHP